MVKHTQIIRRHSQQLVGSVFDHFVGLARKRTKTKDIWEMFTGLSRSGKVREKRVFFTLVREDQGKSGNFKKVSDGSQNVRKNFSALFFFSIDEIFDFKPIICVPLKNVSVTPRISNLCLLTILSAKVQQNTILFGFYFFTLSSARSSMNCFRWGW